MINTTCLTNIIVSILNGKHDTTKYFMNQLNSMSLKPKINAGIYN